MIQANELRIGNWINVDIDNGKDRVIQAVQVHTIGFDNKIKVGSGIHGEHRDFAPISLTPEILEKAGFEIKEIPHWHANGRPGYRILIMRSARRWLMLTGIHSMIASIHENDDVKGASLCQLGYLHQLQNLFFTLKGEELQIQL